MSSTSHLTATPTNETKVNKRHSSFNLRKISSDSSSETLQILSSSEDSSHPHYVNSDSSRKQSFTLTQTLQPTATLNVRRKLSAISLPVPWSTKRSRSPSVDKSLVDSITKQQQQQQQQLLLPTHYQHQRKSSFNPLKMSRDRLLTFDRLFSTGTHTTTTTNDDEPNSPMTDFTGLDESMRSNERTMKTVKENGYVHNSHLLTRYDIELIKKKGKENNTRLSIFLITFFLLHFLINHLFMFVF